MKLYLVIPEGVYPKATIGVFSTKAKAVVCASTIKYDNDGYHTLCVYEYELDKAEVEYDSFYDCTKYIAKKVFNIKPSREKRR
jgi:hypothetical protein